MRLRVQEHGREFDDFTYRIGGKTPEGYMALMSGTVKMYLRAAETYLNDILYQKKAAERANRNAQPKAQPTNRGKWQGRRS